MQTTGEICQLCGHPVRSEVEAAACEHCHAAFHKCCLESAHQVCVQCGEVLCDSGETTEPATTHPLQFSEGELEHPKTSWAYRFSLVVISLAMIMLPLIYVGLVALFGFSVVWYAYHFSPMKIVGDLGVGEIFLIFFFYLCPLFAGSMLTFFLVKPLFAPRREQKERF